LQSFYFSSAYLLLFGYIFPNKCHYLTIPAQDENKEDKWIVLLY
jgi:hypothetical protein